MVVVTAVIVAVVGLGVGSPANASAAPAPGALGGTVTSSAGAAPIGGVTIKAFNAFYGNLVATTISDSSGHYRLDGVPSFGYLVQFSDASGRYVSAWKGKPGTPPVTVIAGATTTVDAALDPALGSLAGTVLAPGYSAVLNLNALAALYVVVADATTNAVVRVVNPVGAPTFVPVVQGQRGSTFAYVIDALPVGSYKVLFVNPTFLSSGAASWTRPQFFDGVTLGSSLAVSAAAAGTVTVTQGSTRTGVDALLVGGACNPEQLHPGADLGGADLHALVLNGCPLTNANFTNANLTGAVMQAVPITGAVWANTVCPDGTNSSSHGNTCLDHGVFPWPPLPIGGPPPFFP
jgi:hypothetical protein